MKLPFRKNKEFLTALYDILGFYPHNIEVYRTAFSHKSLSFQRDSTPKDRKGKERRTRSENTLKPLNNERLEYLGDAVLETVVSDILFRHFPNKREGFLTSTRSKIVQREALNRLATDMGLEKLIQAAQGTRMRHTNIGGNAFEALMGAIYLDRGYAFCLWFISNRVIGRYVDLENVAQKEVNFKSKLLEWSQKNRININFRDTANEGDEKGFRTVITVEGIIIGRGTGRAKKESQQLASKEALTRMRRDPKVYDNIFRAKEKRTAMEAEESFALPKIDEIEETLRKEDTRKGNGKEENAPSQEKKGNKLPVTESDAAYDTAYDDNAQFEVIDTPPAEQKLTPADYEAKGLPAPPQENELETEEAPKPSRRRNRSAKTVNEAVKGFKKGGQPQPASPEEANSPEQPAPAASPQPASARAPKEKTGGKASKATPSTAAPSNEKQAKAPSKHTGNETAAPSKATRPEARPKPLAADGNAPSAAPKPLPKAESTENATAEAAEAEVPALQDSAQELPRIVAALADSAMHKEKNAQADPLPEQPDVAGMPALAEEEVLQEPDASPAEEPKHGNPAEGLPSPDLAEAQAEEVPRNTESTEVVPVETPTANDGTEAGAEDAPEAPETASAETGSTEAHEPTAPDAKPHTEPAQQQADFVIAQDLAPAGPTETEDAPFEKDAPLPHSMEEGTPMPKLRHLSLDDFIFGLEHEKPTTPEDEEEALSSANKPQKANKRRRRSGHKRAAAKNQQEQASPTPAETGQPNGEKTHPAETADRSAQGSPKNKGKKAKSPMPDTEAKAAQAENAESVTAESEAKRKNKRRRRRPSKKAEE